jgi:predicted anti-sigma-YlaC factor YlaD
MSCDDHMAALSARSDGEDPGMDDAQLDAHVATCDRCAAFEAHLDATRGRARVAAAPVAPDLSRSVVRANARADRSASHSIARWLLALVAVQVIVFSVPDLLAVDTDAGPAHAARHLGAFSVAYAAGLLLVVVRPARARIMLNVALVLGAALVLTAIVDVAQGRVPLIGEATHLPELFSIWFLWLLARPVGDPPKEVPGAAGRDASPAHALRLIRDEEGDAGLG